MGAPKVTTARGSRNTGGTAVGFTAQAIYAGLIPSPSEKASAAQTEQQHRLEIGFGAGARIAGFGQAGCFTVVPSRSVTTNSLTVSAVTFVLQIMAFSLTCCDVFKGDLEVPASIDAAREGVTSVLLVTPPGVQQELNVIDSAVRSSVEHVVKITTKASADSPIARRRNHAANEDALIASGLAYTLLRNNATCRTSS